jgi:hypothetical protein
MGTVAGGLGWTRVTAPAWWGWNKPLFRDLIVSTSMRQGQGYDKDTCVGLQGTQKLRIKEALLGKGKIDVEIKIK